MAKAKATGKKVRIDFGDVPTDIRKRGRRIPEGDYLCKVSKVERKKGKESGATYFAWQFQILNDARGGTKQKGVTLYYTTSLKKDALFNLRNLIFAASDGKKNVAGKSLDFDPASILGKQIGVVVEDEEYEEKIRSRAVDIMPPSQLASDEGDDDDDEEDDEDDDEDSDDDDESDDDDDDEDELEDVDYDEDM